MSWIICLAQGGIAIEDNYRIARQLSRTYGAFFARFGTFTEVQRKAIPIILEGQNALISSPTASGKTEAVCAPLIEHNIGRDYPWIILYIVPTRALINDLYNRLFSPCKLIGIKIVKRTGEYQLSPLSRPADIILTTPESFDSMMCRERREDRHMFYDVSAVVLDEIHLIDGTARGEQVRWLLSRLERMQRQAREKNATRVRSLQIIAMSATISNPESMMEKYMGKGAIVMTEGAREIQIVQTPGDKIRTEDCLCIHLNDSRSDEKVLVFCNARKRVDEIAYQMKNMLSKLGYKVYAHHGSLSKPIREEAEKKMKEPGRCVLFATTTLEIGIDIGDVDLVVLDEPAFDIAGLLQRIGRGNRRTQKTVVMPCTSSAMGELIHRAMLSAAKEGWIGEYSNGLQNGVAVQQIMSYIFQSPKCKRNHRSLQDLVDACGSHAVRSSLLSHLLETEKLRSNRDGIYLTEEWLDKTRYGRIHVTIESRPGIDVIDSRSGEHIAKNIEYSSGEHMSLGSRRYKIKGQTENRIEVEEYKNESEKEDWMYQRQQFFSSPCQPLAVKRYLNINDNIFPTLIHNGKLFIFHFGGTPREIILKTARPKNSDFKINNWYISAPDNTAIPPDWIKNISAISIETEISAIIPNLEAKLARPQINRLLPDEARIEEISDWLRIDDEIRQIQSSEWLLCNDKNIIESLRNIIETLDHD